MNTPQPHSSLSVGRDLLFRTYHLTYELTSACSESILRELSQDVTTKLLPRPEFETAVIRDLKGVAPQDRLSPSTSSIHVHESEELLSLEGELPFEEIEDEEKEVDSGNEAIACTVRAVTRFHSFERSSILHTLSISSDCEELPTNPPEKIFTTPFQPRKLRFGLEIFKKSFSFLGIGAWPTVSERLLIEADSTSLKLRIYADSLKKKTSPLLSRDDIFSELCKLLRRTINFDLDQDLKARLSALS